MYIYVLLLVQGKFYIGKTHNPNFRIESHFNNNGSSWTSKYKPIRLIELIEGDNFDEDKYTLKYMEKEGIENVRGGTFCELTLSSTTISIIKKMIQSTTDKCYNCGKSGHFSNECKSKKCNISNKPA